MVIRQAVLLLLVTTNALAHGINGHIHVAAWASAEVRGDVRQLLEDPEVLDAFLFGAAFPDTGYAVDDSYGELTHWEPFIEAFIRHVRQQLSPPYTRLEDRKRIAFLLGVGVHGLQDEIFDTLFLPQIEARDGAGQDEADPGTDAFLFTGGHLEFSPAAYAPLQDVVTVLDTEFGHSVDAETMSAGMARVKAFVVDSFSAFGADLDAMYRPAMPWGSRHYLDATVPGSLASEVPATAAYMEALWQRMNGEFPVSARVVYQYAPRDRTHAEDSPNEIDGWVTLVFGVGVYVRTLSEDTVLLFDGNGQEIPCEIGYQRWGHAEGSTTRLVVLRPQTALSGTEGYAVELGPGVEFVDGEVVTTPWRHPLKSPTEEPSVDPISEARGHVEDSGHPSQGGCSQMPSDGPGLVHLLFVLLVARRARRSRRNGRNRSSKHTLGRRYLGNTTRSTGHV